MAELPNDPGQAQTISLREHNAKLAEALIQRDEARRKLDRCTDAYERTLRERDEARAIAAELRRNALVLETAVGVMRHRALAVGEKPA